MVPGNKAWYPLIEASVKAYEVAEYEPDRSITSLDSLICGNIYDSASEWIQ